MPLLGVLADEPGGGGKSAGKAATKEKFTKFFDLLEEVAERHRIAKVLEDDEEGKETVADEVVRLVVPSLQQFTTKNKEKEFSKSEYLVFIVLCMPVLTFSFSQFRSTEM